jgi:hypothetical protein
MASIAGTLIRGDQRPKVPEFKPIDTTQALSQALYANLQNLPQLQGLAGRSNAFLADEITKAAEKIMPGYSKLLGAGTEALTSAVEGNLPEGVARNIRRYGAEYGVGSGTTGSQFSAFGAVNLLGRESLNYSLNALNAADRWLSQARSATPLFNFQSMFISPAQQIQTEQWNKSMQFNRDWLENQIKVLPSPTEEAFAGLFDNIEQMGRSALSMYAGGAMGGGGGMGGMGGGGGGAGGGGGGAPSGTTYNPYFDTSNYYWGNQG